MIKKILTVFCLLIGFGAIAQDAITKSETYNGLAFRSIGPALTSGRIADIAVNPNDNKEYYIGAASGGVWKTTNGGITFTPVFDNEGSYSIGCITIDPNNSNVIWVGSGENNNQRSVAYGDGVYKSVDGGKSWKNVGLKTSEHIGKVVVDPRNSNNIYVAAYGPLWSAGGERGIYQSTDGGKTWNRILHVSENTGFSDILMEPGNPEVLYATAHQRRRHVFTYISGGPESAIYKSFDGGKNWEKLENGLPKGDVGRIALAIAPTNPNLVYAMIEGEEKTGGFYRSTTRGGNFERLNDYNTAGNYYQEISVDPIDATTIYVMDTYAHVSRDGGKTFKSLGEKSKHVDNHAIWVNPADTRHMLMGCDGGLYETFDGAATWQHFTNLPITQFYRVSVDNSKPFYYVYGGTQDNFSLGGPSRTINASGIVTSDWFVTHGGDGFETVIDPKDPNIVYAQSQYGGLVRYDRQSGEEIGIQPMPAKGEDALRWNWDAPVLISPHKNTRLYFAANKVFKSEDRGNSWEAISPDLTRQLDRNKFVVMDKVWSMDAVAKNQSTSIYGNIVAFDESPLQENLLYAGTDDGLIQISEDGGSTWSKQEKFSGVPERTYVNQVKASKHDVNTVYALFNNHKNGDFKPYVLKSADKGKSWKAIQNNLPERGSVFCIEEDRKNANLLFIGTEFGVFFTLNGGATWTQFKAGLPTIAFRDLTLHETENDLILASFGRGFYVLDNYAPLNEVTTEVLNQNAFIFSIKDGLVFNEKSPLGIRGKGFQGENFYNAVNPAIGATFTYYLKETDKTIKQKRRDKEKEQIKNNEAVSYPTLEEIRKEDREEAPYLLFEIADANGTIIRRMTTSQSAGINRITWDGRYEPSAIATLNKQQNDDPFGYQEQGMPATPGSYTVTLFKSVSGTLTKLVGPQTFNLKLLENSSLPAPDLQALNDFRTKVNELNLASSAVSVFKGELKKRIALAKEAIKTSALSTESLNALKDIELELQQFEQTFDGDRSISRREFPTPPSTQDRVGELIYNLWATSFGPSGSQLANFRIAAEDVEAACNKMVKINTVLQEIEEQLAAGNAPYTLGRLPVYKR